jgi:FAD/FMN-containing dehydrogenase
VRPRSKAEQLAGWGRIPVVEAHEVRSEDLARITDGRPLSRGLGRSYGDSSLPASPDHEVVSTVLADRMLSFDESTGVLRAEAGLSLRDIYRVFLAKDAFTRAEHFRAMETRIDEFQRIRRQWDPTGKLRSAQSARLLDGAGERQLGAAL